MIIDAHTHFYDPHRPQGVPWPNKEDGLIYRTVLPEHHRAVAEPTGVGGTVVTAAKDRLIYGSNWPVCEILSDHATVQAIVGAYFESKGTLAAQKYWWQNATAAYKYVQR